MGKETEVITLILSDTVISWLFQVARFGNILIGFEIEFWIPQ